MRKKKVIPPKIFSQFLLSFKEFWCMKFADDDIPADKLENYIQYHADMAEAFYFGACFAFDTVEPPEHDLTDFIPKGTA